MGDHDLLDYCTFRVEAANDEKTVSVNSLRKQPQQEVTIEIDTKIARWSP